MFIISEVCLSMPLQAAFVGAMAIADLVKTTLGPKGMVRSQHVATCLFAGLSTLRDRIALSWHKTYHMFSRDAARHWDLNIRGCFQRAQLDQDVLLRCRTRSCRAWGEGKKWLSQMMAPPFSSPSMWTTLQQRC